MRFNRVWKLFCVITFLNSLFSYAFADTIPDPCAGPYALLSIIDRPNAGDSACVVPYKNAVVEAGYQYEKLTQSGYQHNFPEAVFRLGLPAHNEFVLFLPNYIHQTVAPHSGFTTYGMGIKHQIGYTQNWLSAVEALFAFPGGSKAFGSHGLGGAVNGIVSYTFNPQFNLTFMLGASTITQSTQDGGQRFSSVNPDLVLTYSAADKVNFYGEVYGQSKTAPKEGAGFNFDAGVIYLLLSNVEIDLEVGQRISGNLGEFDHYVGTGFSVMF